MKQAPILDTEEIRQKALNNYCILETVPELNLDDITKIAAYICDVPIALVSLIDNNRQWFKSKVGLDATETPRDISFCGHAIWQDEVFIVENSLEDERFKDNPLVTDAPNVIFYAGAPLKTPSGHNIGTLCVIDHKAKKLNAEQINILKVLSKQVITYFELKNKTEIIQDHLKKLATIMDNMADGVVLQTPDYKIIDFNRSALKILGMTEDQILGKTSLDPDWRSVKEDETEFPGAEHPAVVCLNTGEPLRDVIMGVRTSKEFTRWINITAVPIFDSNGNGKPILAVTTFSDISERRVAEHRLQLCLSSSAIGIWEWDLESQSLIWDESMYRLYEIEGNSFSGAYSAWEKTIHPDDSQNVQEIVKNSLSNKVDLDFVFRIISPKTKKLKHIHSKAYLKLDGQKKPMKYYGINIDITSEIEAKERLVYSTKMASLGEMAGGIAHEINNPLAIIKGRVNSVLKILENENFERKQEALSKLQNIDATTDRVFQIVKGLKQFSRNSDNDDFIEERLNKIVEETLSFCVEKFKYNEVDVIISGDFNVKIKCHPAEMIQVLLNLLNNSYDAIENSKDKWIKVDCKIDDKNKLVTLYCSDSGPGVPEHILDKIMEPFFTTKDVGKGTGLGLSISKGIIENHFGKFYYDVNAKNCTFVIELPYV